MRIELRTETAEETRNVGEALAALLRPRDTVTLTGDLGAGKTTLVQGVGRGLGVEEHVASPTFTLIREYTGRLPVAHVDIYRLERLQEVVDLGLDEVGPTDRVLLVEWGDAIEELLGSDVLRLDLTAPEADAETRHVIVEARGRSWTDRREALEHALGPWAVEARSDPGA